MQSQDFFQVPYRRDQIEITYKIGFSPPRESKLTHADAAKMFKIERSTFEDQHSRALRGPVSDGAPRILDDDQITGISAWMDDKCSKGEWPTFDEIEEFIYKEYKISILRTTLYKTMSTRFPQYHVVSALPMESDRVDSSDEDINRFYDELESLLPYVHYRFCFNLDETGQVEAKDTHPVKVCVPITIRPDAVKLSYDRSAKRFTLLHTISTDGKFLSPFIIIPRKTLEGDFFRYFDDEERNMMRYQENGFMTDILFEEFMTRNFIPAVNAKKAKYEYDGMTLLIMDNLISHRNVVEKLGISSYPNDLNIRVLWLPPHTSDQIQPLDLGIFGVQKSKSQNIKPKKGITKQTNLLKKALVGLHQASSKPSIVSAFCAAGIIRNITIVGDTVFIKLFVDRSKAIAVRHFNFAANSINESLPTIRIASPKVKPGTRIEFALPTYGNDIIDLMCTMTSDDLRFVSAKQLFKRARSIIQRKEGDDDDAKFTIKVRHSMEQMVKNNQLYRKNSSYKFTDEYLAVLKVARGRNV